MRRRLPPLALAALALILLAVGASEALVQHREDEYVRSVTREVLAAAAGRDFDSKVLALRDHVRASVVNVNFKGRGRPFLRHTAAETLLSGKGRCGEAARVFVNMARAAGIPAQRLYLEGRKSHVAVIVHAGEGRELLVDPTNRFFFPEVVPLDGLRLPAEFESYSTFGWRRVLRGLPSHFVSLGPLNYLFENPHALLACLCFLSSAAALTLAVLFSRRTAGRRAGDARAGFALPPALKGEGASSL